MKPVCKSVCFFLSACLFAASMAHGQHVSPPTTVDTTVLRAVADRIGTDRFTQQELVLRSVANGRCETAVTIDGRTHQLVLEPHSMRGPDFHVQVQDAAGRLRDVEPPAAKTYRGRLAGAGQSRVIASVQDGRITAQVFTGPQDDDSWTVQPLRRFVNGVAAHGHVVYRSSDAEMTPATCGTTTVEDRYKEELPIFDVHAPGSPGGGFDAVLTDRTVSYRDVATTGEMEVTVAEIACDADYEYYTLNNSSVEDTVADIEMILNGVSAIYELDIQATFEITHIIVRTSEPDPYDTAVPQSLLEQFTNHWVNNHGDIHRDLAHLFTGRDLSGTPVGVAWRRHLCENMSFALSQSRFTTNLAQRIAVTAHEIGHNFDAGHCDYGDWWCRIMCSSIGGCSGYHTFCPLSVDLMESYMIGRTCLGGGTATPVSTSFPFFDNFEYATGPDPDRWMGVDGPYTSTSGGTEPSPIRSVQINEYDSMRTLPMVIDRPATVSYWTNHKGVEASAGSNGKSLIVEYFSSINRRWQTLEQIHSDGIDGNDFIYHEHALPVDAYGDFFALRFSGWGTFADYTDKWYVDDVAVTADPYAGDCDGDGDVDLDDFAVFAACLAGPADDLPPGGCLQGQFELADVDRDGDVDLHDFGGFQYLMAGVAICGNALIETGEWCDGGGESATCNADCTFARCGDGQLNVTAGEECDESGETAGCDPDCTRSVCGDGYLNIASGEECDDGGETWQCDLDCTEAYCGDGTTNVARGEECDGGGWTADCDANCTWAVCGDGTTNAAAGEECDHRGESATCDADCTFAVCGDGVLNPTAGEECDDGNTDGGDGCSPTCTLGDPMPNCTITFDISCPNVTPVCGTLFADAGGCAVADYFCVDTPPSAYLLDTVGPPLLILLDGDLEALSVVFWSESGGYAEMEFFDEEGLPLTDEMLYTSECEFEPPWPEWIAFSRPVRSIVVTVYQAPVWIDTFEVNPSEPPR